MSVLPLAYPPIFEFEWVPNHLREVNYLSKLRQVSTYVHLPTPEFLIEVQDILIIFNIFRPRESLLKTGWLLFFHKFPNRK